MTKPCSVCISAHRDAIDRMLVNGASLRELEETYHLSRSALSRHRADHINVALIRTAPVEVIASNASLTDQLRDIQARTMRILNDAVVLNDPRLALVAIREARANLETLAKIELVLSTVASQRRQEPADVSANIAEWKAELLRRSGIRDD